MTQSSFESRIKPCELTRSTFVIGIGSPHGEDQAGWAVIDGLSRVVPKNCILRKAAVPHDLLNWLDVDSPTHIIDASVGRTTGVKRFSVTQDEKGKLQLVAAESTALISSESILNSLRSGSTHQINLLTTLHLVAAIGRLPRELVLWTISIKSSEKHGEVGSKTRDRINQCVSTLAKELRYA
jgi:hydrogenase maturation protease